MSSVPSVTTSMSMVPISNSTQAPCRHVNSNLTQPLLQNIDYLLTGPLLFSVIIIGLTTNACCLFVFGRSFHAVRIHFYLLVLAMWDVSLEIGAFFMFALPTVLYGEVVLYGEYSQAFPFFYFLSNVARNGSVWIVVTVALERYFALCYPYKFQLWNTEKRVYILLSLVSCLAFIYGLPRFFELKLGEKCRHPDTSLSVPSLVATALRKNRPYWLIYRVAGGFIFYSIGPFLLLTFLTIRISMEIGRSQTRLRETTRKNGRRESQLYRFIKRLRDDENGNGEVGDKQNVNHWMHVAVITKFLIFHSAPTVLDIYVWLNSTSLSKAIHVAGHASNLMVVLNSSCNFFIYLRTSAHFKRDLSDCLRRRKPPAAYLL